MKIRKALALILTFLTLFSSCALADRPVSWRYSFSGGEVLAGEGMDGVREFLDEVQLGLTTEHLESGTRGEAVLYSYGKPVFTLRAAADNEEESFGLYCSLMGECALMCRQDQVKDFLMNMVKMLFDLSVLKQESLPQARSLAERAGDLLMGLIAAAGTEDPAVVLDLRFYLARISEAVAPAAEEQLDGTDPESPGAVLRQIWQLNEAELNALIREGIQKLKRLPLVSDLFLEGKLKIGKQTVTEEFLLDLFSAVHGDTTVIADTDQDGRIARLVLQIPDISSLVEDPEFGKITGLEFTVQREETGPESRRSSTEMRLSGLDKSLVTIRMERGPGSSIQPLPTKKTWQVGEMNSEQLWKMIRGLGFTIAANAINLVMEDRKSVV